MVGERGWCRATESPPQPDLARRGMEQVPAADDEVDTLPGVVDDDAETVRPVAVPVADRQIAGWRDVVLARAGQHVHPGLAPIAERHPQDGSGHPAIATTARAAGTRPRATVCGRPCRESRARAVAPVDQSVCLEDVQGGPIRGARVGIRLADRTEIRTESEPVEVLEQRLVELRPAPLAIVVLDPEQDARAAGRSQAPGPDRVRDVP